MSVTCRIIIVLSAAMGILSLFLFELTTATPIVLGTVLFQVLVRKIDNRLRMEQKQKPNSVGLLGPFLARKKWHVVLAVFGVLMMGIGAIAWNVGIDVFTVSVLFTVGVVSLMVVGCRILYLVVRSLLRISGGGNKGTSRQLNDVL